MEKKLLTSITDTKINCGLVSIANPLGLNIYEGEALAVVGANGAGKTLLAKAVAAACRYSSTPHTVKQIEFSDIHSLTGCKDSYYQQRFESTMNDEMPTVGSLMEGRMDTSRWARLCDSLSLHDIEHKRVNYLSSGELRKFLIVNMMAELPELLILDNPYIGLDASSRGLLNSLIEQITACGVTVMLLLCDPADLPEFADRTVLMQNLEIVNAIEGSRQQMAEQASRLFARRRLPELPGKAPADTSFKTAFELRDCRVAYGKTTILDHVDWRVERGEHWALLGENGAGKSTLLSLICADNPQSYSNDIRIFDRRRGTGETIWDIKRRIGYLSPEMHLYFRDAADTLDVVASGLRETAGFFRPLTVQQRQEAQQWMEALGIGSLARRRFPTLSSGEQRMALLARTLIKRAPLLILDEPMHGLDAANKALALEAIERVADSDGTTMVFVTHYESEIPRSVDKRKILKRNNITNKTK